jgi:hypothetical protein
MIGTSVLITSRGDELDDNILTFYIPETRSLPSDSILPIGLPQHLLVPGMELFSSTFVTWSVSRSNFAVVPGRFLIPGFRADLRLA